MTSAFTGSRQLEGRLQGPESHVCCSFRDPGAGSGVQGRIPVPWSPAWTFHVNPGTYEYPPPPRVHKETGWSIAAFSCPARVNGVRDSSFPQWLIVGLNKNTLRKRSLNFPILQAKEKERCVGKREGRR